AHLAEPLRPPRMGRAGDHLRADGLRPLLPHRAAADLQVHALARAPHLAAGRRAQPHDRTPRARARRLTSASRLSRRNLRSESRMNYNSVAEIFDDIDGTRARLLQLVEGLSAEQQSFRPAPEKWSVAEVVEHLSIVERRVAKLVAALLDKTEAG